MVITREKPIVVTQKNMINKSKHNGTKRHQNTKKDRKQDKKQGKMDLQNSLKTINEMAIVTPYLLIIPLNINELNSLIKRQ